MIEELLTEVFLTVYHANGKAELRTEDHTDVPVTVVEEFHSQFQLDANQYRDNNNYIRYNMVETQDSRFLNIFEEQYEFVDIVAKPPWVANVKMEDLRNVTEDGLNFYMENTTTIFGTYYFYHTQKSEFRRVAMSWLAVGSEVGGLYECLYLFLGGISLWYNEKFKMSSLISKFHFLPPECEDDDSRDQEDINVATKP